MPLPFALPAASPGAAALSPALCHLGTEVAAAVSTRLAGLVGAPVELRARLAPGPAWPRSPAARLVVDLPALPARAVLEVEPALVARLVDRLAGGDGAPLAASALTPLEQAAFELLALLALDGAGGVEPVERLFAPRLTRAPCPAQADALGVELALSSGAVRGWARLALPAAAVQALAAALPRDESPLRLPVSVRRGTASLLPEELEALAPGDVLLLDAGEGPDATSALVLPGGFRTTGRLEPAGFRVEGTAVTTRTSQIPVTLEVELCRVELPLGELARLTPGAVVPLAVDRRGRVTLRAGERAVARGELVEIDGAVGVRIDVLEVDP